MCENSASRQAVINNIIASACRFLYDVIILALMIIRHYSEEKSNLSHQVPALRRVEAATSAFRRAEEINNLKAKSEIIQL